jgi:hypothetical protein
MVVCGQLHVSISFPNQYPWDKRLGGPQTGLDMVLKREILALLGFEPWSPNLYLVIVLIFVLTAILVLSHGLKKFYTEISCFQILQICGTIYVRDLYIHPPCQLSHNSW